MEEIRAHDSKILQAGHVSVCICPAFSTVNVGLFARRCGYSKAKQDPDEEKMHFHNGHSKSAQKKAHTEVHTESS